MKKNCWEAKQCGCEPGGCRSDKRGVCPASTTRILDGVHGGQNAGRACWVVTGTLCSAGQQGTFAQKLVGCLECDFYKRVMEEEGDFMVPPSELLTLDD